MILQELLPRRYAHVTFVNSTGAYEALSVRYHVIHDKEAKATAAYTWHQPHQDLVRYIIPSVNWLPHDMNLAIIDAAAAVLNDDCIEVILSHLDFQPLYISTQHNDVFRRVASRTRRLEIRPAGVRYTLMDFRKMFRAIRWGNSVLKLTLDSRSFINPHLICLKLPRYIGQQLTELTMTSFKLTTDEFAHMRSLLTRLHVFEIGLAYDFDYQAFNRPWPNLHTLRIKTTGHVHGFADLSNTPTVFPVLEILSISTMYLFYNDLITHLVDVCPNLKQLTLRGFVDIYASMAAANDSLRLEPLRHLQRLTKLHLSLDTRTYMQNINEYTIAEIFNLPAVRNLTLEITNPIEALAINIQPFVDALSRIGRVMVNLNSLTLSCIPMEPDDFVLMIRNMPSLERFFVNECIARIETTHIESIVELRRIYFNENPNLIRPLKLQFNVSRMDQEIVSVKYLEIAMFYILSGNQTVFGAALNYLIYNPHEGFIA